jgi:hypothetical protein
MEVKRSNFPVGLFFYDIRFVIRCQAKGPKVYSAWQDIGYDARRTSFGTT